MYVSEDKNNALVYYVVKTARPSNEIKMLKLKGLDENVIYDVNGKTYSGKTLMHHGIMIESLENDGNNIIFKIQKIR